MNIEQFFALHVTSADARVAYKIYLERRGELQALLEDLDAIREQAVSAAYLREAILAMERAQTAHLEAIAALLFEHERGAS